MAFSYNHVAVAGNLTRDPELRDTPNSHVANFTVAVNRKYRAGEEQREEVAFITCEAWGRTAEIVCQYLQKGSPVFVEGRLKQDNWEDKDGNKRSSLKISASNVQFMPRGGANGEAGNNNYEDSSQSGKPQRAGQYGGQVVASGNTAREASTRYAPPVELSDDEPPF